MAADSEFEFAIGSDVGGGSCDEQQGANKQPQKGGLRSLLAQQPKSVGGEGEAVCSVCEDDKQTEQKYCDVHNRAFECIERAACKPAPGMEAKFERVKKKKQQKAKAKAKSKGKKSKSKGKHSSTEASSSSSLKSADLTAEHKAFLP